MKQPTNVDRTDANAIDDDGAADPAPAEAELRRFVSGAAEHGQRLDKALAGAAPEFSRSHLQQLVAGGHVRIDGRPCGTPARRLRAGQAIEIELIPTAESLAYRPQAMALPIVFEDEHVIVIDKPAGLVVHPAAGNWSGTLLNGLLAHHAAAAQLPRAGIVHRLDKDTSGLMVVGKTLPAVTALVREIAARRVHRRYLAIAQGLWEAAATTVEAPIGRDPAVRTRMAVVAGGKPARTDFERLAVAAGCSALRCTLHSGRTHQIRVHAAHSGHPLLADATYGGRPALGMTRQALHAWRLAFAHPASGAPMSFESQPPADFAAAWSQLNEASAKA